MEKSFKTIMTALAAMILVLAPISSTFADSWTQEKEISKINLSEQNGEIFFEITAVDNDWGGDCDESQIIRIASDDLQKQFYSMALAALLSGKKISAYTSGCTIIRMYIISR